MELTLEQVLAGRGTSIKGKEYLSTAAYVEPFLERMSKYTDKFIFNGIQPDQITLTKDGDINTIGLVGSTLEMLAKKYEPNANTENQPSQSQNNANKQYKRYAKS